MKICQKSAKTIGIMTMGINCLLSNYGSFWQHYALRRTLAGLGYATRRLGHPGERTSTWSFVCLVVRVMIVMVRRLVFRELMWKGLIAQSFASICAMRKFRKEFCRLIGPMVDRAGDMVAAVAGGDQVFYGTHPWLWLADLPPFVHRLSYAASTDWRKVTQDTDWVTVAKKSLKSFGAIGFRETFGVDWYNNFAHGAAKTPDPVFLVATTEWQKLASQRKMLCRKTLLAYLVNVKSTNELHLPVLQKVAESRGLELKIIGIQGTAIFVPRRYQLVVSPSEFIKCILEADAIVTNSFHGSAFASIFERPFVAISQENLSTRSQNLRLEELLEGLGRKDLLISLGNQDVDDVDRINGLLDGSFYFHRLISSWRRGG